MISRFHQGVSSFFEGIRLLRKDKNLRLLGFIPALMSLTLYTVGLIVGVMYIDSILSWVIKSNFNEYNAFLKSFLYILSFVLLVCILYFAVFMVVSILAIPVCTTLSQRVLIQSGYLVPTSKTFKENVFTFTKMLRVSILKFAFIAIISILLFVASFVPMFAPIALYLSLMILTWDCMDYAMEHDEKGLRQRFRFFLKHWVELSGFALCMAVILAIPFIHFILLPSAVLGTSVLYVRLAQKDASQKEVYGSKTNS